MEEQSWPLPKPFGESTGSRQDLAASSDASALACGNLLDKAELALLGGDRDRASRYVERAVALPFDLHQAVVPVAWSAHMRLFNAVNDVLEACEPDDSLWLDAALAVLRTASAHALAEMRDVLKVVADDYEISRTETRRIRDAIRGVVGTRDWQYRRDLDPTEIRDRVLTTLDVVNSYLDLVES